MKKSEIVSKVNVEAMATELGLEKADIKMALTWSEPVIESVSVKKISSLTAAAKLYRQTKNIKRKLVIAERALELCHTFEHLSVWCGIVDSNLLDKFSILNGKYAAKKRAVALKSIEDASTFAEIHNVWLKSYDDALGVEDMAAFQKMLVLASSTPVLEVLETFYGDIGTEILSDGYDGYQVIVRACKFATPESALAALKHHQDWSWDGEQETYPIKLLIQKAAQLYPM